MNTKRILLSASNCITNCFWMLLTLAAVASFAFGQSGDGSLTNTTTTTTSSGECVVKTTTYTWTYTDSLGAAHSFPNTTNTHILESESCTGHSKSGCGCPPNGSTSQAEWSTDNQYYLQATGGSGDASTLFDPAYKVVSVLYSPPGNGSSQGYGTSATDGTTTSIGTSISSGTTITFTAGISNITSVGASMGFSSSSGNSKAFTQTWTDGTSVATDDNSNATYNPTASNTINHNLDTFAIWLNPRVAVIPEATSSTTPQSYNVGSQSTPGVSAIVADIILLPAITMEATPPGTSGVTTVPVAYLVPQAIAGEDGNSYMPGLGAICKNNSLYREQLTSASPSTPTYCTQANQCGCVPSDFVTILQTDPLLNYSGTTYTASPYAGTESPLEEDSTATTSGPGSGPTVCGENPVPETANCRYVIVPIATGSTTPLFEPLSGSAGVNYTISDSTGTAETLSASQSTSVGVSYSSGFLFGNLTIADTWTYTDSESIGSSTGTANTMEVTLATSTAACDENVNIFEDTLYHTFAFQVPTGITSCP
jgi:hypothetical protein